MSNNSGNVVASSKLDLNVANFWDLPDNFQLARIEMENFEGFWIVSHVRTSRHRRRLLKFTLKTSSDMLKSENVLSVSIETGRHILMSARDHKLEIKNVIFSGDLISIVQDPKIFQGIMKLTVKVTVKKLESGWRKVYDAIAVNKEVSDNIFHMLGNEMLSDFAFNVKGEEIKVHKAILASASPVFAKMFSTDMEESRKSFCRIDHIEPDVFKILLRFIYGGKVSDDIGAMPKQLYEAAHYYEITMLEKLSKEEVSSQLCLSNALETFKWANVHQLDYLEFAAWTIVKSDILKITVHLKYEPLSVEDVEELLTFRARENEVWTKFEDPAADSEKRWLANLADFFKSSDLMNDSDGSEFPHE